MAIETQTAVGDCPTHGEVEGTREVPKITFPPIITAVQRAVAVRRRPYLCPQCGTAIETD